MSARICLLPGDGIGPEVISAARSVLEALQLGFEFDSRPLGFECFQTCGSALPAATLEAARSADACLLGAVGSPSEPTPGYRSAVVELRRELDLYACLRRVTSPPRATSHRGVDLWIVRENSEGLYGGRESSDGERATTERVVTRTASERITRAAVELARNRARKHITLVHKANVLRATCGLFRSAALSVLNSQDEVSWDELLVDTAAYELARAPERFDVLLTTNLFGDVLSDLAAAFGGGLGLASSANLGEQHAVFEPVHGSAPDLVGTQRANPLACIRAAAQLCSHLGRGQAADDIDRAVESVLSEGPWTPDLGGDSTTGEVAEALISQLLHEREHAS